VYFGKEGKKVPDPYFDGKGPERSACTFCGACMTGCRYNAKNTLDKNYLYLAQQHGATILAEQEVVEVKPIASDDGSDGYVVRAQTSTRLFKRSTTFRAKGVVFSGGVLGTVSLLLKLKETTLPRLSDQVGKQVRTNNESLICVTQLKPVADMSKGIAIGAILHTDEHSHLEICRYGSGSGAWKLSFLPFVEGSNMLVRLFKMIADVLRHPLDYWRYFWVKDWAKSSLVMLFMQTLDSTVTFSRSWTGGMRTQVVGAEKPTAFIPRAIELARKMERLMKGKAMAFGLTPLVGIPGTAHILGGAVMGESPEKGVIDRNNQVFGYQNMLVCDGSMISANPGVNPALSITALSERAMAQISPAASHPLT
jgi:cholesterol oxidase